MRTEEATARLRFRNTSKAVHKHPHDRVSLLISTQLVYQMLRYRNTSKAVLGGRGH